MAQILKNPRVQRMTGLEPVASAWKAEVLPLYDIRMLIFFEKTIEGLRPVDAPQLNVQKILHAL